MGAAADRAPLAVRGLRRDFGGVHAVEDTTFSVQAGTITGLIGPNGAGKSTTLSMIAGALKPTAGSVVFHGREIAGLSAYRVARLGLIRTFQLSSEFARLSVLENLLVAVPNLRGETFGGALLGRTYWGEQEWTEVERARTLLERFEMAEKEHELAGRGRAGPDAPRAVRDG